MIPIADSIHSRSFPWVNWMLIIVNVFCFFIILSLGDVAQRVVTALGVVPERFISNFSAKEGFTVITSMFLHAGWLHLIGNMIVLYIFGDNVEDRLGSVRYLCFYLLCGLIAAATHVALYPASTIPTVGASGAISGVMAAYVLLFPFARVITVIPIIIIPYIVELPAIVFIGIWFVLQLFSGVFVLVANVQAFGGVAWWAHVGGFVGGLILLKLFTHKQYVRRHYVDEYYPW